MFYPLHYLCLLFVYIISLQVLVLLIHFLSQNSSIADRYISSISLETGALHGDSNKISHGNENGFGNDTRTSFGYLGSSREDMPIASTSDNSSFIDQRPGGSLRSSAVSSLKELVRYKCFR